MKNDVSFAIRVYTSKTLCYARSPIYAQGMRQSLGREP